MEKNTTIQGSKIAKKAYRPPDIKPSPHSGISTMEEYNKFKDFQNREIYTFMPPQVVEELIYQPPVHPWKRTMVGIFTDSFKTAVKILTADIKTAKKRKHGVYHLQCCNIIWIGRKPKVHCHVMNDLIRKMFDPRNLPKALYNPDYLPPFPDTIVFNGNSEPSNPAIQVSITELKAFDDLYSSFFGPTYERKVTPEMIEKYNRDQQEEPSKMETSMTAPPSPKRQTPLSTPMKTCCFEVPHHTMLLEFLNEGAEIGSFTTRAQSVIVEEDDEEDEECDDELLG